MRGRGGEEVKDEREGRGGEEVKDEREGRRVSER